MNSFPLTMIGEELPLGVFSFQATFLSGPNIGGKALVGGESLAIGTRKRGQSLAVISRAVEMKRRSKRHGYMR
jgi:hypothetical protein